MSGGFDGGAKTLVAKVWTNQPEKRHSFRELLARRLDESDMLLAAARFELVGV
jgi:hypothetical protein